MALHNWVFGHAIVLFSANSQDSNLLVVPPSAYAAAVRDMLHLDFAGAKNVLIQIANLLSGPAESYATAPLNAVAIAIVIYVVLRGRQFDPWLRLIGGAALGQHVVALFYNASVNRYHFLTWFLTMLVDVVWFQQVGITWLRRRYPRLSDSIALHPWWLRLASGLTRLQKMNA